MRKVIAILLVSFLLGAPTVVFAAKVTAVPATVAKKYNIDTKWYKQYTTAKGIPVIASACGLVDKVKSVVHVARGVLCGLGLMLNFGHA